MSGWLPRFSRVASSVGKEPSTPESLQPSGIDAALRAHAAARVAADLGDARGRGQLRAASVRDAAERLGVGERTVWRWIAAGGRCSQAVLAEILKTLGALAELRDDLRHPHALRHTCATQLLQHGANAADVRRFLGHASVKTTSIYLASDDARQEEIVIRRARGRSTLAAERDAAP